MCRRDGNVQRSLSYVFDVWEVGQYCTRTRVCGLGGCKEVHHRLLHKDKTNLSGGENKTSIQSKHKVVCKNVSEPVVVNVKPEQSLFEEWKKTEGECPSR